MYRACSVKITSARGYDVGIVQSVDGYKNLYFMYSHRQPPFDGDTADGTLLTLVAARPAKHDSKQESQRRKGTLIPGLLRRKLKICWEVFFSSLPLKSSHWRAHDHWNVGTQISNNSSKSLEDFYNCGVGVINHTNLACILNVGGFLLQMRRIWRWIDHIFVWEIRKWRCRVEQEILKRWRSHFD